MDDSTPKRPFEARFTTEDWYQGSVSEMMDNHAHQWRGGLPEKYHKMASRASHLHPSILNKVVFQLEIVCLNVHFHESLMCSLLLSTPDDQPISEDAWFVYDGYNSALEMLFGMCQDDWMSTNNIVIKFREAVVSLFIGWFG